MEDSMVIELAQFRIIGALIIGFILGLVVQRTNFCMSNCFTSIKLYGSFLQFKAYLLALLVAIIGVKLLSDFGYVNPSGSIYLPATTPILSYILGGFIFGIGMVYAGGCASRIIVRVGEGNLGALLSIFSFNIAAGATLTGYLVYLNQYIGSAIQINLNHASIPELLGINSWLFIFILTIGLISWIIYSKNSDDFVGRKWMLTAIVIGLLIVAGWYVTGYSNLRVMDDHFLASDPSIQKVFAQTSLTFAKPTADFFNWIANGPSVQLDFGIATLIGVLFGSASMAILTKSFHLVVPPNPKSFLGQIIGGLLMGFGAIVSFGCNIGQGLTGMSVLSLGGFITITSIMFGAWSALFIKEKMATSLTIKSL